MVTVAIASELPIDATAVAADFSTAGFEIVQCGVFDGVLLQQIVRVAPEIVVAVSASPSDLLFDLAATLRKVAPCPFVLFTTDSSPAKIDRAAIAGVHSYVVDGYSPRRLRSVVQVAVARFREEQARGDKLDALSRDLQERKQVERAKGLLMRSRGLSEAGAFELMRSLAMRRRLRLANVADAVIALSIGAEAVNRAGQLRMLAQRLVRCYVQLAYGIHAEWAAANLHECVERIDGNIGHLRRTVADRGCDADIERLAASWTRLRAALAPVAAHAAASVDALGEALTRDADTLTDFLETSGLVTNLRVINLAGRQRMLSQVVGKLSLLLALDTGAAAPVVAARAAALQGAAGAFTLAMAELGAMPIRTPEIERWLRETGEQWLEMAPYMRGEGAMPRCIEVSERLLDMTEALTEAYERAAQVLIGDRIEVFEATGAAYTS